MHIYNAQLAGKSSLVVVDSERGHLGQFILIATVSCHKRLLCFIYYNVKEIWLINSESFKFL